MPGLVRPEQSGKKQHNMNVTGYNRQKERESRQTAAVYWI